MESTVQDGLPGQAAAKRVIVTADGETRAGNCWMVPKGHAGSGYRYRYVKPPEYGQHLSPRSAALLAIIEAGEQEKGGWNREELKTLVTAIIPSSQNVSHTIQFAQKPLLEMGLMRIEPGEPLELKKKIDLATIS